ncbi:hypothetical protein LLH23_17205 [bacterium]|nr:hypothetical protein [bacterium]
MRQTLPLALLIIIALSLLPAPGTAAVNLAVGMSASDVSLGEALLVAGIASFLGFDTTVVVHYHSDVRLPLSGVLTTLLFSRMLDADHHRLAAWRSQGRGWGQIAHDLGVHPGAFNKLRKGLDIGSMRDDDFERLVVVWTLSRYYGVGEDRVRGWQQAGTPLLGVLIALDLGAKSHRSVSDLLKARRSLHSWNAVADKVGVGKSARKRPQKPKGGQEFRGHASGATAGGGQGNAAGQGHGQGQSHGQGQGHGQGKGKAKGH